MRHPTIVRLRRKAILGLRPLKVQFFGHEAHVHEAVQGTSLLVALLLIWDCLCDLGFFWHEAVIICSGLDCGQ